MMNRTTIMLPSSLKVAVMRLAKQQGVSLGEFIRESLKLKITKQTNITVRDPFFAFNKTFSGSTPTDLAKNHDDYLYE